MRVAVLLVVGQGVTIAVLWLVVRRLIRHLQQLSVLLGLISQQTNAAVTELQRHRGILKFQKPPEPPDEPPTLFV